MISAGRGAQSPSSQSTGGPQEFGQPWPAMHVHPGLGFHSTDDTDRRLCWKASRSLGFGPNGASYTGAAP